MGGEGLTIFPGLGHFVDEWGAAIGVGMVFLGIITPIIVGCVRWELRDRRGKKTPPRKRRGFEKGSG